MKLPKKEIAKKLYEFTEYENYDYYGDFTNTQTLKFTYDKAGRLEDSIVSSELSGNITSAKVKTTGTIINNLNQTVSSTSAGTKDSVYFYDADGIRTRKFTYLSSFNDVTASTPLTQALETDYYYMGSFLLFASDINGCELTENVIDPYGNIIVSKRYEEVVQQDIFGHDVVVDWTVAYFTINTDLRGSTSSIVRADGSLASGYIYDEFGNQIKTGDTDFINDATYTGAIFNQETNLVYMNSRYYDSSSGRFISQDTYKGAISNPQTQHLYSYTSNNPINYIDPTGHYAISVNDDDYQPKRKDIAETIKAINKEMPEKNPNPNSGALPVDDIDNLMSNFKEGHEFATPDAAAAAFALYYGRTSINGKKEYGTFIYKTKSGKFSYVKPIIGYGYFVHLEKLRISGYRVVGYVHTHAEYAQVKAIGEDDGNNQFSGKGTNPKLMDIGFAHTSKVPLYVLLPSGVMRKYDPNTEIDIIVNSHLKFPRDKNCPARYPKC